MSCRRRRRRRRPAQGADAPLPKALMDSQGSEPASRRGAEGTVGAEGLPQSKHSQESKALTCGFAPLAGLEPAPYGLEVGQRPSKPSRSMPSSLLRVRHVVRLVAPCCAGYRVGE
jgi:hypothetical protein